MALSITWEPIALASGCADDEAEAATWGRLRMAVVDGERVVVLTACEEREARFVSESVSGPVVALAEWFACVWGHLFHSRRARPRQHDLDASYSWLRARNLRFTGDGCVFPDVTIARVEGGGVRVECHARTEAGPQERVVFITSADVVLGAREVERGVAGFVESVLARLRASFPRHPRTVELERVWRVATDPNDGEHAAYVATCHIGELWGSVEPHVLDVVRASTASGVSDAVAALVPLADAATLAGFVTLGEDLSMRARLAAPWSDAALVDRARLALAAIARDIDGEPARSIGGKCARVMRELLGVPAGRVAGSRPVLVDVFGLPQADLHPLLVARESVLVWRDGRRPVRVAGFATDEFIDTRDVFAVLCSGAGAAPDRSAWCDASSFTHERAADGVAVLSPRLVGSSAVASAFAAEWLAPLQHVEELVGGRAVITLDDIVSFSREMRAPFGAVHRQVVDHGLAELDRSA